MAPVQIAKNKKAILVIPKLTNDIKAAIANVGKIRCFFMLL